MRREPETHAIGWEAIIHQGQNFCRIYYCRISIRGTYSTPRLDDGRQQHLDVDISNMGFHPKTKTLTVICYHYVTIIEVWLTYRSNYISFCVYIFQFLDSTLLCQKNTQKKELLRNFVLPIKAEQRAETDVRYKQDVGNEYCYKQDVQNI